MKLISKKTGTVASYDGTEIYYEVRGQGEPMVFVYGIACLMNHFHHQIDYFSQKYQVITFDLRGHNRSEIPEDLSQMTVKAMAQDLLALLEHLKIKKAHFVGHSFGVPVLIEFSKLSRKHLHSLTFINGFAKNPIQGMFGLDVVDKVFSIGKMAYYTLPQIWNPVWKFSVQNPVAGLVSGILGGFNLQKTEWKDIEIYARAVAEMSLDMFIPLFEDMMRFDAEDIVKRIHAPTLVLAGAKDFVTPLRFQEQLHQFIPASRYVVLPEGSHCTQLDFPQEVNQHIETLISQADFS